ncbi:hypothetical protein HXX76_005562 [Chlamydomonas incerta]|uniref:ABC transporter domain-containing protein n=1 Tax=Chlamydomonas incerta TaxID=51695 RepID=A0A835T2V6_CHLIN|nr:hypothetical protein HXX76_005562 [Chlamydomonas incerta]|eukprot:KAG2437947.1 hypothetical protein HXX76_005562 [Chlamydomonas incerta]
MLVRSGRARQQATAAHAVFAALPGSSSRPPSTATAVASVVGAAAAAAIAAAAEKRGRRNSNSNGRRNSNSNGSGGSDSRSDSGGEEPGPRGRALGPAGPLPVQRSPRMVPPPAAAPGQPHTMGPSSPGGDGVGAGGGAGERNRAAAAAAAAAATAAATPGAGAAAAPVIGGGGAGNNGLWHPPPPQLQQPQPPPQTQQQQQQPPGASRPYLQHQATPYPNWRTPQPPQPHPHAANPHAPNPHAASPSPAAAPPQLCPEAPSDDLPPAQAPGPAPAARFTTPPASTPATTTTNNNVPTTTVPTSAFATSAFTTTAAATTAPATAAAGPDVLPEAASAVSQWYRDEERRRLNVLLSARLHSGEVQGVTGGLAPPAVRDDDGEIALEMAVPEAYGYAGGSAGGGAVTGGGRQPHKSFEDAAAADYGAAGGGGGGGSRRASGAATEGRGSGGRASGGGRPSGGWAAALVQRLQRGASGGAEAAQAPAAEPYAAATAAAGAGAGAFEEAGGASTATAVAESGGAGSGDGAYGDLLAPLAPQQQVVLRFDHISSFVSAQLQPPSALQRARQAAAWVGSCWGSRRGRGGSGGAGNTGAAGAGGKGGGGGRGGAAAAVAAAAAAAAAGSVVPRRQILFYVSGRVVPGEVLALMGPSGSGKTSLLSVLGGRAPPAVTVAGAVTVDGAPLSKAVRRQIGFVLQDDVLYETLTVHETLLYAGLLRLPRRMPAAEKRQRVEGVLRGLGLGRSRDTIIGGFFRRGISGGERKRVSVGHELLINPAVLMLDEPTSGLDSTTALHLVQLLRQLAAGGRAVVTTIHQPSSRLYCRLDRVMLLAEGHVAYCGDANMVGDWFGRLGFGLPYGVSLADFILDAATGEVVATQEAADAAAAGLGRRGSQQPLLAPAQPAAGANGSGGSGHSTGSSTTAATAAATAAAAPLQPLQLPPLKVVGGLSGRSALVTLYTTFEHWYALHPGGLTDRGQLADVRLQLRLHNTGAGGGGAGGASEGGSVRGGGVSPVPEAAEDLSPSGPEDDASPRSAAADGKSQAPTNKQQQLPQQQPQVRHQGTDDLSGVHTADQQQQQAGGSGGSSSRGAAGTGATTSPFAIAGTVPNTTGATAAAADGGGSAAAAGKGGGGGGGGGGRGGASYWQQVRILTTRAIKVRRFESLSGQNLGQLVAVALITGLLWFQRGAGRGIGVGADVTGLLFFELLFPSFRSLFSALFTFPNEYRMLKKERPAELIYPSLFIIIVYWLGGLRPSAGAFFSNWAAMLLVVLLAQSWGLLFGGTFMDPKSAQTVTTVVMLTFLLVGGFYVKQVPAWIGWIKYISFVYWGYNLLLKVQFGGATYTGADGAPVSVQHSLGLPTDPNASKAPEVLVLLGMLVILRSLTYVVLRHKTEVRQPKQPAVLAAAGLAAAAAGGGGAGKQQQQQQPGGAGAAAAGAAGAGSAGKGVGQGSRRQ